MNNLVSWYLGVIANLSVRQIPILTIDTYNHFQHYYHDTFVYKILIPAIKVVTDVYIN